MKETHTTGFQRGFAMLLTVLLTLHFVCVPSLTAFAEDDVEAIGIGGDTSYRFPHYNGKTVDITFRRDYSTKENYALFTTSEGEEERVVLSQNEDKTVPGKMTIEKCGVKVSWECAWGATLNMVSTMSSGYLRADSYEGAPDVSMTLSFESTDSKYKVHYYRVSPNPNGQWESTTNADKPFVTISNKKYAQNKCAMTSVSGIQLVLSDTEAVNLNSTDLLYFEGLPETVEYDPNNRYPKPEFTLIYEV